MAGAALAVPVSGVGRPAQLSAAAPPALAVAHGPVPSRSVPAALEALGGIRRFVSRGDVVVVKPNIGWDRTPEYAANTNPEVVAAVVALCLEAGAKRVKIFDHPVVDARRAYRQSGIAAAAAAAGGEVVFMDDRKFKEMKLGGNTLKSWPLYTEALEADKLINIPIAKVHGTSVLTLGMKNLMGIMGGWRGRIHQRIDESLADLTAFVKPSLVILDAVRILTANGPQGGSFGDVKKLDLVIAGADSVAVDAYGATLFGMKPADLGFVRLGQEMGLGSMELDKLPIRKINL
ncbi:MAG: DUF362 domain-containing protein [Deltaproteobacteria bacterium]|nr:DUF362 domain-containing protein [Deltaproteobacteria bacterium]